MVDDAPADGLTLALSGAARAVARLSLREEELDTTSGADTLIKR